VNFRRFKIKKFLIQQISPQYIIPVVIHHLRENPFSNEKRETIICFDDLQEFFNREDEWFKYSV